MALPKLFERIFWHNNTTPSINEDNLNAMSKGISDIDDRIIQVSGYVLEVVPQIQAYLEQAEDLVEAIELMTENPPYIGANGNWYVWDTNTEQYVDSGIDASITVQIADVTALEPDATPYVINTGTSTDPIFHLYIPRGATGQAGVSPVVIVSSITGGHEITIFDADHPTGQSFNVMDGAGSGDMMATDYDPLDLVKNAGGISTYVEDVVLTKEDAPTVLTQILQTGNTQVMFTDSAITSSKTYDIYTDMPNLEYTSIDDSITNTLKIDFEAQSQQVTVKLVIRRL